VKNESKEVTYYELDGALFRKTSSGLPCPNEVWTGAVWQPYAGESAVKAIFYGDHLTPTEVRRIFGDVEGLAVQIDPAKGAAIVSTAGKSK